LRREGRNEVEAYELGEGKEKVQMEEKEQKRSSLYEDRVTGGNKSVGCRPWQLYAIHMDIATGDSLVILLLSLIAHDTP
jgi:hypothetical protein